MERVCLQCGKVFEASRSDALFHDDLCRKKYKRTHKDNGKPEFVGANIIDNLKEPVSFKPEPPRPLPIQPGKKEFVGKVSDEECIAEWQRLLQKWKMVMLSDDNRYVKQEAYKQLIEESRVSGKLTYNQLDGIKCRCEHQMYLLDNPDKALVDTTGAERMQKIKGVVSRFKQPPIDGL